MRESKLLLQDILTAAEDIRDFTRGMSRSDLAGNNKTRSAVLYKFAVMGEATKLLPDEIRAQYPDVPWRSIAGLRDKVIHGYIGVDFELLWMTIETKIPLVTREIQKILDES